MAEKNINLSVLPYNEEQFETRVKKWLKEVIAEFLPEQHPEEKKSDYITIDEVRNMLPEHPQKQTLYGYVCSGKIPVEQRNKPLIFSRKKIQEWLAAGRPHVKNIIRGDNDK